MSKQTHWRGWEDISDVLTPQGIQTLQVGRLLRFDYEGSQIELVIMAITKRKRVWARRVTTYLPSEVTVTEKEQPH